MKDKDENITYLPTVQIQDDGMKFKWGDSEFDLWNRMAKEQENTEASAEMEMAEHWSEEDETTPFPISGTITVRHENAAPQPAKIDYKGYFECVCTPEEMAEVYEHLDRPEVNGHEFATNEYLILKNAQDTTEAVLKWNGNSFVDVKPRKVKNVIFGDCAPLDEVQQCAFDSIQNNEITVLYGKAGCGKTHIPLSHILSWLDKEQRSKLYIIYPYEPMRNAKTLGFEKGDHTDKVLMSGSIGNILATKLGSITAVERMIADDKLEIVPTANIRGMECSADSVVLVTEAQNLDAYTLKTIVQRCKEGCKQIYEGDILEQADVVLANSGMARLIEVFKGNPQFGCVKLHKGYRSPLCELADLM